MAKVERIYTVPLGDAYDKPRNKRCPRAVKILKGFITKHMKLDGGKIVLSSALNSYIWRDSIQKPPRRVKVRLIKEDETVRAYLSDEKIEAPKKEEKKPEAKKEEAKKEPVKEEPKKEQAKKEEPKKAEEKPEKEGKPPEKETPKKEETKESKAEKK